MTDIKDSVSLIVAWLRHAGVSCMEDVNSTILGGDPTSKRLREELLKSLSDFGFNKVTDLNPESEQNKGPRKFVVDASNGEIQAEVMPAKPEDPDRRTAKLMRTQFGISRQTLDPEYTDI